MVVDAAVVDAEGTAEGGFSECVAGDGGAGEAHEAGEKIEFGACEGNGLAGDGDFAGAGTEHEVVGEQEAGGCGDGGLALEDGAHAGCEFARVEGLGEEVVCAGFEAADAVGVIAARGEHDDGHVGLGAYEAEEFAAVGVRQSDVEEDESEAAAEGVAEARGSGVGGLHEEAVHQQEAFEVFSQRGIVVDQQYCRQSNGHEFSVRGGLEVITEGEEALIELCSEAGAELIEFLLLGRGEDGA